MADNVSNSNNINIYLIKSLTSKHQGQISVRLKVEASHIPLYYTVKPALNDTSI
jgi:hypothetical protein